MGGSEDLKPSGDNKGARSLELLGKLCNGIGVSGYEDRVRALISAEIAGLVDEISHDALGNLIAHKQCGSKSAPLLMLDAHMDEIGLVVSYIEPTGFLRFALVGGYDERVLPGHGVTIVTEQGKHVRGVIGMAPPHLVKEEDRRKPVPLDAMFIDVGARTREEAEDFGIAVGDSGVPFYLFEEIVPGVVMGKALDDRAGCALLIRLLEELRDVELSINIAAVFSTFEEVGARGAMAATYTLNPDMAVVFEGTTAGDFPGISAQKCPATQGNGPAITLMDRTAHCSPKMFRFIRELAAKMDLPLQVKTPIFGGTNAARIHTSRSGVPTAVLSMPCRYIHSPYAIMRMEDFDSALELAVAFARQCYDLVEKP